MEDRPWFKFYDPGVKKHIDYPSIPLFHFLEESARTYPNRTCTLFRGEKISYAEMNELSDRLAAALDSIGIKKGDPVGIFLSNSPLFVLVYYAILKAGGIVVATNFLNSPREIEHQLNDAGVEVMIALSSFYEKVKEIQPSTKLRKIIVSNIKEYFPGLLRILFTLSREKKTGARVQLRDGDIWLQDALNDFSAEDRPNIEVATDDRAIFQYSGGTTGPSKAAVILHRNVVANTLQICEWMSDVKMGQETVLIVIPLFHLYGMIAGLSFGIYSASTLVMIEDPGDIANVIRSISKYKPTIFPDTPTMYNAMINDPDVKARKVDLSSIRECISGSAPLRRETKEKFDELIGGRLVEGYGLSEAPAVTHCNPLYGESRTGSIGIPLPDVDARIVDRENGVTVLPPGDIGELVIKSPNVMVGYHNNPTETANSLKDGWLYTDDIARMDEDGFFYIVDRKKELIKPGGFEVWPREVEEAIAKHPKVQEVGVAGIPDPYRGETVKAWIVLKPGQNADVEEIRAWCRDRLAPFKVPTYVEFRDALPKTTIGVILRRELVKGHLEAERG